MTVRNGKKAPGGTGAKALSLPICPVRRGSPKRLKKKKRLHVGVTEVNRCGKETGKMGSLSAANCAQRGGANWGQNTRHRVPKERRTVGKRGRARGGNPSPEMYIFRQTVLRRYAPPDEKG